IQSTVENSRHEGRSRTALLLMAMGTTLVLSLPSTASAQTSAVCGPEVKAEIVKAMDSLQGASDDAKLAAEAELYKKYQYCAQASLYAPSAFFAAARECGAVVSNLGSIFYEEMSCAGYDPQRRQFASPVKIKQTFGFGGVPLPGSREHVLHCVADAAGV